MEISAATRPLNGEPEDLDEALDKAASIFLPGIEVDPQRIPANLKGWNNWVTWSYENRDGKLTKVPKNPFTGGNSMSNNSSTWGPFDVAFEHYRAQQHRGVHGIGFQLGDKATAFIGVDLDHCRDKETGDIAPWAQEIVNKLSSYSEITPSGEGLRIFIIGLLPARGRKKGNFECYDSGRFLTVTGNHLSGTPFTIEGRYKQIEEIHRQIFGEGQAECNGDTEIKPSMGLQDDELISKARNAANGALFVALFDRGDISKYQSQSEADMALCGILNFWCGNDPERIDRLFRQSALHRGKWDIKHHADGSTYGQETIRRAIGANRETYSGQRHEDPSDRNSDRTGPSVEVISSEAHRRIHLGFNLTDAGNAESFKELFGNEYIFGKETSAWFHFDGIRWVEDQQVVLKMLETVRMRAKQSLDIEDPEKKKAYMKWCLSSESRIKLTAALSIAEAMLPLSVTSFDCDPLILCVSNGAINLKTGELFIPTRELWLSRTTSIQYDRRAECPRWLQFLMEIFNGDRNLIDFVQKTVGYSLTGSTIEQVLFILFGTGANGKSVFLSIIGELLGDYALATPASTWKDNPYHDGIPNDIARMAGARFVKSIEVKEGTRLNEERVKALTGGDQVTARFLHNEFFEFTPVCKFWISVNHKPIVQGTDEAIWRRIRLIPFEAYFPPEKRDEHLIDKLRAELPGILSWAVTGCLKWQREGLRPAEKVQQWTDSYREESDLIAQFLQEKTERTETGKVKASDLYKAYEAWCKEQGEYCVKNITFGKRLQEKGFQKKKEGNVYYRGLEVRET